MKHVLIDTNIEYCSDCPHYDGYHYYCRETSSQSRLKQWVNNRNKIKIPEDCPLEEVE